MPAIRADGLAAGYGGRTVLTDISLEISGGEVVALLGPNGSGKTTLIRCFCRLLQPESGTVSINESDIRDKSAREIAKLVSLVPQHEDSVFDFSVREIVEMGRYAWGNGQAQVDAAIERAHISDLADRRITELSGGERQRALFARALAQDTPVMLLDEPTAHMDVGYQISSLSLLRQEAANGKAIAVALHDLNLAAGFASRAALLYGGRIVLDGLVEEVLQSPEVDRVYGASFARVRDARTGRIVLTPEFVPAERRTAAPKRIHLIGGGGTAAALLTKLWQLGHDVTLGVTHETDSDAEAARRLGVRCASAPPFTAITPDQREECVRIAEDAELVVVSAAPYGPANLENLRLARQLREAGKTVVACSRDAQQWDFTGGEAAAVLSELQLEEVPASEIAGALSRLLKE